MGRAKRIGEFTRIHCTVPMDLLGEASLFLASERTGGVPYGTWSTLFTTLMRRWLAEQKELAARNRLAANEKEAQDGPAKEGG